MKRLSIAGLGLLMLLWLQMPMFVGAASPQTDTEGTPDETRLPEVISIVGADGTTIDLADLLQATVATIWDESEAYTLSERRMRVIELIAFTVDSFATDATVLLERAAQGFSAETLPLITATSVMVAGREASTIVQRIERAVPADQRTAVRFAATYPDRVLTRPEIRRLQGSPASQLLSPAQVGAPLPTTPEAGFVRAATEAAASRRTASPPDSPTPAPRYDNQ